MISYKWLALDICRKTSSSIKRKPYFPVRTGFMRDSACYPESLGGWFGSELACVKFDSAVAPYIPYLEEGTTAHDIPNSFGYGPQFGIGGRFSGKFHPGSYLHVGFISVNCYDDAKSIALSECSKYFRVVSTE